MSPAGAKPDRTEPDRTEQLPNFVVIGAQKAGTSTLHRLLQAHPQSFMCDPKEPHFFSADEQWARGGEWYRSLFAGAAGAVAIGEASTTYAMYPHFGEAVARLTSVIPEPRLVYILREPVARMRSAYLHGLAGGTETRSIDAALRTDPRYLLTSSYAFQLERWLERIPRERILLLSLEQLRDDPDAVMARLFRFLGIDPTWRPSAVPAANPSEDKRPPRWWWRALGEAVLRLDQTDRVPEWMVRLNQSGSPVVRREVAAAELDIREGTADALRRALHADLVRLREHWGPNPAPDWLQDDSPDRLQPSTST